MRYITQEQLYIHIRKQQLIPLTDSKTTEPDLEILDAVNSVAVAEVEGYLRGIYSLPLSPVPEQITAMVADIMRFRLNQRRDAANMPEDAYRSYKTVLEKLRDIQARKIVLDAPAASGAASVSTGTIQSITPPQTFGTNFSRLFNED